jgi:shikimate kinase
MDRPIIITGFMGAGKTTVVRALAQILDCPALDLDEQIYAAEGRTAKQIIEQDGEPAFRVIETRELQRALATKSTSVIALGGGAWTVSSNRDLIAQHNGFTVWLDAPFELCWQRISEGGTERPLAPTREQAFKLYSERRPVYALSSFHLISSGDQNGDSLAMAVAARAN